MVLLQEACQQEVHQAKALQEGILPKLELAQVHEEVWVEKLQEGEEVWALKS